MSMKASAPVCLLTRQRRMQNCNQCNCHLSVKVCGKHAHCIFYSVQWNGGTLHIIFSPIEWGLGRVNSFQLLKGAFHPSTYIWFADGSKSRSGQVDKGWSIAKVKTKSNSMVSTKVWQYWRWCQHKGEPMVKNIDRHPEGLLKYCHPWKVAT